MSRSFVLAAFIALVAAGVLAPAVQAQYKPRPGSQAGQPSVWSPKPVSQAPQHFPLQAPKLPNSWQPALRPPVFGQSSSKPPTGANPNYRHAPANQPQPAFMKPVPFRPAPTVVQRPAVPARGMKPRAQPQQTTAQVIQAVQPQQPARPPIKDPGLVRPHGPRNPNNVTIKPHPEAPVRAPHGHGPRNPQVAGGVSLPQTPKPPTAGAPPALDFGFRPPTAPPVRPAGGIQGHGSGTNAILLPSLRPQGMRPATILVPRPTLVDPSPQPSRPAVSVSNSSAPTIRVRVRGSSGKPVATPQTASSKPRPTVTVGPDGNIRGVSVSDASDETVGRNLAALSATENSIAAEAAEAFDSPDPPLVSAQQDQLVSNGLDAIASGDPLTDEQRAALLSLADMPFSDPIWGRLQGLGLDASQVRGAAYAGIQEELQRAAVAAGQPADSIPTLSAEANADLAFFRDVLQLAPPGGLLTPAQQAAAAAGLDAMLQGRPMTAEQREAVTAVVNGATTAMFAQVDMLVGGTTNLRGNLGVALQADADAQAALAGAGAGAGNSNQLAAVGDFVERILRAIGGGGVGDGVVMPVPAWPMGGGFEAVDPGFVEVGISGPAVAATRFIDPGIPAAPAPGGPEPAPGLNPSGTAAVDPSAPAGPAPSPQPGPGEAKYDRRYLSVRNDSPTRLALFVQYETISSSTGEWKWYPNDPTGSEAVAYSLEAGQEVALKRDDWSVNARRVRIWAATEDGQAYDQYRGEDLWLVEEQPSGERYYIGTQTETFSLAFGEPAAAE